MHNHDDAMNKQLTHYHELHNIYQQQPKLAIKWATLAASNLGHITTDDFIQTMRILDQLASDTNEQEVTNEVNYVSDMLNIIP